MQILIWQWFIISYSFCIGPSWGRSGEPDATSLITIERFHEVDTAAQTTCVFDGPVSPSAPSDLFLFSHNLISPATDYLHMLRENVFFKNIYFVNWIDKYQAQRFRTLSLSGKIPEIQKQLSLEPGQLFVVPIYEANLGHFSTISCILRLYNKLCNKIPELNILSNTLHRLKTLFRINSLPNFCPHLFYRTWLFLFRLHFIYSVVMFYVFLYCILLFYFVRFIYIVFNCKCCGRL